MKVTKGFVLLAYMPLLFIELDLDHILGVLPVFMGIHIYPCLLDADVKGLTEELRPIIMLIAGLQVIKEHLGYVENLAMFALYGFCVVDKLFYVFQRGHLRFEDLISLFDFMYCFREISIYA
jgi:hypothetical protein